MSRIPDPRPLASNERQLLERLLRRCTIMPDLWLDQLSTVTVASRCGCGCPTLDLAVGGREAAHSSGTTILAEAGGTSPEGVDFGIILHAREGILSELEVYPLTDSGVFSLPPIDELRFYTPE